MSFTNPVEGEKERRTVSVAESNIVWNGYKVTGSHTGNIQLKSGELEFDGDMLTGGSFVIDMTSMTNNDLEGEWKEKLMGHLKSDDFFSVDKFPTASFNITQVVSRGKPGEYKIVGDLTIKGITKEIKFQANVEDMGDKAKAVAEVVVDRSEFNVRYGSGSFFDNLGDKTIYDEFDLQVNLVVNK
ncbi:MAG: YceI family protein [Phaeodactylibacter sp.]|nr:YceI family protein [Phaeodactylibacter sp.]MCI4647823.1 YceI family protein [Phaeodactylibacter sp.]MCI5092041.1 YceI family protein [Phaeodactylibacter sp.]